ncbi:hypothetical protein TNCV_1088071 [Trichonephila clavipes]|uniref:Uncharacterized protein n=1 Tax=Trichonephila clavipes TaxID=2585209 RepID=A0A8X6SZ77_TRICX|nr:hypothetical protein TNCV_1088071 [Trichonephila clavipes]
MYPFISSKGARFHSQTVLLTEKFLISREYNCGSRDSRCDEAGLFPLIAKSGTDRRGEIPVVSLIAGKEFRKWVVRNSDPYFPGYPDRQKKHCNIVLSFSHDSVTTAGLRTYNMSRDSHRRPTNKRSEGLRGEGS